MLLLYLTIFNVQFSIEMPVTTALGKPNNSAVFKDQAPLPLYIESNSFFAKIPLSYFRLRLITHRFYAKYEGCTSPFKPTCITQGSYVECIILTWILVQSESKFAVQMSEEDNAQF
jgi:hypothetical protein